MFVFLEHFLVLFEQPMQFYLLHLECLDIVTKCFDSLILLGQSLLKLFLLLGLVSEVSELLLKQVYLLAVFADIVSVDLVSLLFYEHILLSFQLTYFAMIFFLHFFNQLVFQLHLLVRYLVEDALLLFYYIFHFFELSLKWFFVGVELFDLFLELLISLEWLFLL